MPASRTLLLLAAVLATTASLAAARAKKGNPRLIFIPVGAACTAAGSLGQGRRALARHVDGRPTGTPGGEREQSPPASAPDPRPLPAEKTQALNQAGVKEKMWSCWKTCDRVGGRTRGEQRGLGAGPAGACAAASGWAGAPLPIWMHPPSEEAILCPPAAWTQYYLEPVWGGDGSFAGVYEGDQKVGRAGHALPV